MDYYSQDLSEYIKANHHLLLSHWLDLVLDFFFNLFLRYLSAIFILILTSFSKL